MTSPTCSAKVEGNGQGCCSRSLSPQRLLKTGKGLTGSTEWGGVERGRGPPFDDLTYVLGERDRVAGKMERRQLTNINYLKSIRGRKPAIMSALVP